MNIETIISQIAFSRRTDLWCAAAEAKLDASTKFTNEEKESIRFQIHNQRGLNWFKAGCP